MVGFWLYYMVIIYMKSHMVCNIWTLDIWRDLIWHSLWRHMAWFIITFRYQGGASVLARSRAKPLTTPFFPTMGSWWPYSKVLGSIPIAPNYIF
jgi:hypothetical protein